MDTHVDCPAACRLGPPQFGAIVSVARDQRSFMLKQRGSPAIATAYLASLEIPFVFDTHDGGPTQMLGNLLGDNPPQELASTMHASWVSIITRGDPGWLEYERARRSTMRFDTTSRLVNDPRAIERALWESTH